MSLISLPSVCLHCPHVLCSPVQGSVAETTLHMMAAAKSSAKLENQSIIDYKITEPHGNYCREVDKYYIAEEEKIADFGKKKYLQIYCSKRADCPLLENRCVMDWGETPSTYIGKYFEKDEPSDLGPPSLLY